VTQAEGAVIGTARAATADALVSEADPGLPREIEDALPDAQGARYSEANQRMIDR